jgi:hypothetical protein
MYPNGAIIHYVTLVFACEYVSGQIRVSSESTEVAYFSTGALPENTLPAHVIRIQDALANQETPFVR